MRKEVPYETQMGKSRSKRRGTGNQGKALKGLSLTQPKAGLLPASWSTRTAGQKLYRMLWIACKLRSEKQVGSPHYDM